MSRSEIPFALVAGACADQGIEALAVIDDPGELSSAGLDRMVADGIGDMGYMAEHRPCRLQPGHFFPGLERILCVALPYQPQRPEDPTAIKRARYAAGKDYHQILRKKLAKVGKALCQPDGTPYASRAAVDSAPVNERTLATHAGLGWLGKNALLLHPQRGSYHVLGFLFTAAPLERRHGGADADRCGACRRCVDGCPTGAIVAGRVLSERCISYLTIEHHGVIPRHLAQRFQGWWFGCDICQEVCPWNRFAPPAADERMTGRDDEVQLLALRPEDFDTHFAGRPVRRIGYERFRRNLLVACWSLDLHHPALAGLLMDPLPLVAAQAQELGLHDD